MSSTEPLIATRKRMPWFGAVGTLVLILVLALLALMWWWDYEPSSLDVQREADRRAQAVSQPVVVGSVTTATLIASIETLLDKRGGYLSNDLFPPGAFMDNVPNWEFGVLSASRDLSRFLRSDFSRSQTQSAEDRDLMEAEPLLSSPNDRWLFPSSEGQYRKAASHLNSYLVRLADADQSDAQFYARADNLTSYLRVVSSRLGSLSQRLSASVGQVRLDTDLAGDRNAQQSTPGAGPRMVQTPWTQIDDVFYESRGYTWALLQQLHALQRDFGPVLRDKNAQVSLQQVVRELEEAQKGLGSPVILNGSPFGFFANHSLVMANYVSRANAAIIDLMTLLERG
ncbi:MAG TPA: DUF2333 family protein [Tahibacter sp.]|uniref:DUF2333 family protein n=1 Tax=Tahibacter sp. TaxID=2056211 RepID=UPI002BC51B30|nr:DUF2333 family protein [Tahibacter sp.]HSX59317.1 DUF2333 family protein [Tahibacter sp.]